ncbi:competence/damage-inducible protein A [Roseimaritima ulvae]|uniref:Competence-damage inducible protein n=1 Tax=Roseimaritima ulvae TaxID=980254 RepID=A0A5B9QPT4_9BACT|nr:molybdopterin-binding protein [Roseimaritima ulvae]QEG39525.1 Putative competence-damage inducible protein [Roseimaritima ulvae]
MLTAEVIAIGDEMTTGARIDTNSAWLSQQLALLGIRTLFQTTVADDHAAGVQAFQIAAGRANVVVATGGLGPTRDDLTREVLADVIDQPLEFRQDVMDTIAAMFTRRSRTMPERNRAQAMFPVGSRVIPNPQGTAPGLDVSVPQPERAATRVFALPGVPAEMRQMFDATVRTRLIDEVGAGRRTIRQHVVKCFGVGESEMESRLGDMIARDRQPSVGITVSRATISLRITADGESEADALRQIEQTRDEIYRLVPEFIFGEGETFELQHAVAAGLTRRNERLLTVELGAACPLSQWMAEVPSAPQVYRGGLFAPDLPAVLGAPVRPDTLDAGLQQLADRAAAEWVLVVDRYPTIPQTDQPLPAFPVALTLWQRGGDELHQRSLELGGHPDIIQARIAKAALDFCRTLL